MNYYFLFKSLHLISVISWMAGLLYLPRIFVYHAEKINDKNICHTFKIMEKRLMYYIMTPAMFFSWVFGILLILSNEIGNFATLWLQLKLLFVILLTIFHFYLVFFLKKFARNENNKSAKFFRVINEIPTILLILIIFIIIYKPL